MLGAARRPGSGGGAGSGGTGGGAGEAEPEADAGATGGGGEAEVTGAAVMTAPAILVGGVGSTNSFSLSTARTKMPSEAEACERVEQPSSESPVLAEDAYA